MRRSLVLLFVLIFVVCCWAQEKSSPRTPKFTARTELVTVPVMVARSGSHVPGLRQQDFAVLEDGKPKPLAFFEEVEVAPAKIRRAVPPAGNFTNAVEGTDRPAGLTIILLDRLLTP